MPLIEEVVLDVYKNVRDNGPVLEVLISKCLKLGQFHGVCMTIGLQVDGIAMCNEGLWEIEKVRGCWVQEYYCEESEDFDFFPEEKFG
ncbi:hypothetical protein CJ030_MR7G009252 [Morella rubra]|uniref:Uncharacterized protein n=1 Tax=Morella rubra TaxID=262757 RepID=A0A6A1V062_9ROSI|nr:hypothetical protein CJ030_MR7G009252 [Morella rubra]